ncbi:hypothetical protein ADUPG1_007729 [Aduncisulcus paluster]|uniref:Uncharacterized protein n=1 Tax=Aduncisulcus paluster TaxID=2918883 RepID=A0ABQ5KPE8_9EUKA|nr:hypothetical protein ADUPG1_007729 [Aduncisulcus paluster]
MFPLSMHQYRSLRALQPFRSDTYLVLRSPSHYYALHTPKSIAGRLAVMSFEDGVESVLLSDSSELKREMLPLGELNAKLFDDSMYVAAGESQIHPEDLYDSQVRVQSQYNVCLWKVVNSIKNLHILDPHPYPIKSLCVSQLLIPSSSPDSSVYKLPIVISVCSQILCIWDADRGECIGSCYVNQCTSGLLAAKLESDPDKFIFQLCCCESDKKLRIMNEAAEKEFMEKKLSVPSPSSSTSSSSSSSSSSCSKESSKLASASCSSANPSSTAMKKKDKDYSSAFWIGLDISSSDEESAGPSHSFCFIKVELCKISEEIVKDTGKVVPKVSVNLYLKHVDFLKPAFPVVSIRKGNVKCYSRYVSINRTGTKVISVERFGIGAKSVYVKIFDLLKFEEVTIGEISFEKLEEEYISIRK